jgi:hypothetical protein
MSGVLKESLASWREAHGFGILCIHGSDGERFMVVPVDEAKVVLLTGQGFRVFARVSEAELHGQLVQAGFSEANTEAAIQLAREWATTFTRKPGSGPVTWGFSG